MRFKFLRLVHELYSFYQSHLDSNGKVVDFGGWALPVNYGSKIKEHEQVQ